MSKDFWESDAQPVATGFWDDDAVDLSSSKYQEPKSLSQTIKDMGQGLVEGVQDLSSAAADAAPFSGILDKAASAAYAGAQEIGDIFRDHENQRDFSDRYAEDQASRKDIAAKMRERSPDFSTVGDIMGGISAFTTPMLGAGMKGAAGVATRVGGNAALAALDQATKGDNLWDSDAAKQAATLTGGIQAGVEALPYVGKAVKAATKPIVETVGPKIKDALGKVGKTGMKVALGVPEEDAAYYLAKAEGVNNAKSMEEIKGLVDDSVGKLKFDMDQKLLGKEAAQAQLERLEQRLIDTFQERKMTLKDAQSEAKNLLTSAWNQTVDKMKAVKPPAELRQQIMDDLSGLRSRVSEQSSKAFDALEQSGGMVPGNDLKNLLHQSMQEMRIGGREPIGEAGKAYEKLGQYYDFLNDTDKMISATDAKKLIQMIDSDLQKAYQASAAEYSPESAKALKRVRGFVDNALKQNKEYAAVMQPLAKDAKVLSQAIDAGFADEKSLIGLLNSVNTPKGELTLKMLDELGQRTGTNYRAAIQEFLDTQAKLGSREAMEQLKRNLPEYQNLEKVNKALSFLDKPRTDEITRRMLNMSPQQKALKAATDEAADTAQLAKQFSGWTPANTESKIKSVMQGMSNGGKIQQTKELEALSDMTGVDFKELLKNRKVADLFEKGYRNGSRNVNLWSMIASAAKFGNLDQVLGAMTGASIDSFGPKMGKKLMDSYLKVQQMADSDKLKTLGKFGGVLSNAAKRGNAAFTATHYMLMQDPQYRKAIGE